MKVAFKGFSWKIAGLIWACFLIWGALVTLMDIAYDHLPMEEIGLGTKILLTVVVVALSTISSEPLRALEPNLWALHFRGEQDGWWVLTNCTLVGLMFALAGGIVAGFEPRLIDEHDRSA